MKHDEIRTYVAVVAAVISLIGMCVTIFVSCRNLRATKSALELQHFNATQSLRDKVRAWGGDALAVLSEATILCELDPARAQDSFERRNQIRSRLSELIDRGRWFFENDKSTGYGAWKRPANQGLAPPAIDLLKAALWGRIHEWAKYA